jgi:serine/threonine protein kinase
LIEDAITEISVMNHLTSCEQAPWLLRCLGVFRSDEKVYVVTEYATGGELFDTILQRGAMKEDRARHTFNQILQAVNFLHRKNIAHRDISLENILCHGNDIRVIDFAQCVTTHDAAGDTLWYFGSAGKGNYRAPECTLPATNAVTAKVPQNFCGECRVVFTSSRQGNFLFNVRLPADAQPGSYSQAELVGFLACPLDMFALGVCLFMMLTARPAWAQASLSDEFFRRIYSRGDAGLGDYVQNILRKTLPSSDAMDLLVNLLKPDPFQRLESASAEAHPWLANVASHGAHVKSAERNLENQLGESKVLKISDDLLETSTCSQCSLDSDSEAERECADEKS